METKYNTPNELNLKVTGVNNQVLINEECCTSINIILRNDGQIQTSFLGAHNPEILHNLEKAMKAYFKGIKKTLKAHFVELDEEECHDKCCHEHEDIENDKKNCCCHSHDEACDGQNKDDFKQSEECCGDKKDKNCCQKEEKHGECCQGKKGSNCKGEGKHGSKPKVGKSGKKKEK